MPPAEERDFAAWMRLLIRRVCEKERITRGVLATRLEVSEETVLRAIYKGKVGFPLVLRLCRLAKATPEEVSAIEFAWLKTREGRVQASALRRSMSIVRTLMEEVDKMEEFLRKKGLFDEYARKRKGRLHPLHRRAKEELERGDQHS
ncbi:MAG TPA: hypothetical protein ENK43_16035 [Planctomycetes bacterium]|nr:hypothetical protein [Planctomycetota bacterium]